MSDLPNPYSLTANDDRTYYSFVTDETIEYVITMDDASCYIEDLPPIFKIYEFGFSPIGFNPSESRLRGKNRPKIDSRIKDTVQYFLLDYLKDSRNSLIMAYEVLDSKYEGRFKLFDNWCKEVNNGELEKYDQRYQVAGAKYPSMGSLIIHTKNEYKTAILQMVNNMFLMKNGYN